MLHVCLVLSAVILGHVLPEANAHPRIDAEDGKPAGKTQCSGRPRQQDLGEREGTKPPAGLCQGSGCRRHSRHQQLARTFFSPRVRRAVSQQQKPVDQEKAAQNVTSGIAGSVGQKQAAQNLTTKIEEPGTQKPKQRYWSGLGDPYQQQSQDQLWPGMASSFDQQPQEQLWPGIASSFDQQPQEQLWPMANLFDQQPRIQPMWPDMGGPIDQQEPLWPHAVGQQQPQQQMWQGVRGTLDQQQPQDQLWPGIGLQQWPGTPGFHQYSQATGDAGMKGWENVIQQEQFQSYRRRGMPQQQQTQTNNQQSTTTKKTITK